MEWGSIANWVSGTGSLVASCVALFIADRGRRIHIDGYVGKRVLIGGGFPKTDVLSISVTNIGTRAAKITNVGFECGRGKEKRFAIVTVGIPNAKCPWLASSPLPISLEDGETANWQILLTAQENWIDELVEKKFVKKWIDVETLRFTIHTSQGHVKYLRPELPLRSQLHELLSTRM